MSRRRTINRDLHIPSGWRHFREDLDAAQSLEDAQRLVDRAPHPRSPARKFYDNLEHFLGNFNAPDSASDAEKRLYAAFVQRIDSAGHLRSGQAERIIDSLRDGGSTTR
jgi:hypothetical protein